MYVVAGSGSGSKFYDKKEERSWEQVVIDDNEPIYMILDIGKNEMVLRVYGEDEETLIVDSVQITN